VNLQQWAENGWLKSHTPSRQEIRNQLAAAERELVDARKDISNEWRFAIAYNAALPLPGEAESKSPTSHCKRYPQMRRISLSRPLKASQRGSAAGCLTTTET
jgi:hypothetical protein